MYPETDRVKGREGKELNTQLNTVDAAECVSSRARVECKKRFYRVGIQDHGFRFWGRLPTDVCSSRNSDHTGWIARR